MFLISSRAFKSCASRASQFTQRDFHKYITKNSQASLGQILRIFLKGKKLSCDSSTLNEIIRKFGNKNTKTIFEEAISNNRSDEEIDELLASQALLGAIIHGEHDFKIDYPEEESIKFITATHALFLKDLSSSAVEDWYSYIPFALKNDISSNLLISLVKELDSRKMNPRNLLSGFVTIVVEKVNFEVVENVNFEEVYKKLLGFPWPKTELEALFVNRLETPSTTFQHAKWLLAKGVDINLTTGAGLTLLFIVVNMKRNSALLSLILKNYPKLDLLIKNKAGLTAFEVYMKSSKATLSGFKEFIWAYARLHPDYFKDHESELVNIFVGDTKSNVIQLLVAKARDSWDDEQWNDVKMLLSLSNKFELSEEDRQNYEFERPPETKRSAPLKITQLSQAFFHVDDNSNPGSAIEFHNVL